MMKDCSESVMPSGMGPCISAALSPEGLIQTVSHATGQLTGYAPDELVAQPLSCIVADSDRKSVDDMLQIARDRGHWSGRIQHCDRNGRKWEARAALNLLAGRGKEDSHLLLISVPVDGFAAAPDTSISVRLREIAHELNNPLAVMMGFTQLVLLEARCDAKTRSDLERIYSELGRLSQIVDKFHSYAISLSNPHPNLEPAR